jgi:rare lipoprotein A
VYGVSASPRVADFSEPVPKGGGTYKVGAPYTVAGKVYVPQEDPHYRAEGLASWYGDDFHGRQTANGEAFDLGSISAAHPTMPLPSYARVTNLSNGHSLIVRVNDRGPFKGNRIIDVSVRAAQLLGFHERGLAWVRVEYVGHAPLEGSDDRILAATLRQDEPAPAPSAVRVAGKPSITPVALVLPPPHSTHYASAYASDTFDPPTTNGLRPAPSGADQSAANGTEQFVNGRGLY